MVRYLFCLVLAAVSTAARPAPAFEDSMAQRTLACTVCHGKEGRAGPDGFYPRIAGKPAGYLYNQLLNFRDGRRRYGLMAKLLQPLSDSYLQEIAQHFAALDLPYPTPAASAAPASLLERGRTLALHGDAAARIPACVQCHGSALTGVVPDTPGLLGLPRDYLNAQLGAWRAGQRSAHAPDCMGKIARQLAPQDLTAVAAWLAAQPLPADSKPALALARRPPLECGGGAGKLDTPPSTALSSQTAARGGYLVRVGNCLACHTERGGAPFAGGGAIDTPFGTLYASNITPDRETGIGAWSADDFWRALHDGRARDGRLLYPAFPYPNYTRVTRADADAMFAYLRSVVPRKRRNTAHQLRWPYSTQVALAAWRALYFSPGEHRDDPARSADWNRGAYLVRGLGHCSACHGPRNALGASSDMMDLSGGLIPMKNWYAPALTSAAEAGLAHWPQAEVERLLRTGVAQGGTVLGPMAEVVLHGTQHLAPADLRAMAAFLRALPQTSLPASAPTAASTPAAVSAGQAQRGARVYADQCAQCHGEQGEGVPAAYPRLAGNRAVLMPVTANLVQVVLNGGFPPATAGNPRPFGMPPFATVLSDADLAAVLSHIRRSWGNQAAPVSELAVGRQRGNSSP